MRLGFDVEFFGFWARDEFWEWQLLRVQGHVCWWKLFFLNVDFDSSHLSTWRETNDTIHNCLWLLMLLLFWSKIFEQLNFFTFGYRMIIALRKLPNFKNCICCRVRYLKVAQENKIPIRFWLANVNGWHQSNQGINHTWHRWGSNVYPCDHGPNTLQTEISPHFIVLQIFLMNFYGNALEICNQLFLWSCVTFWFFAYTTSAAEINYLVPCFIHNPFQNCPKDNITPTATQLPLCVSGLWGITRLVSSPGWIDLSASPRNPWTEGVDMSSSDHAVSMHFYALVHWWSIMCRN